MGTLNRFSVSFIPRFRWWISFHCPLSLYFFLRDKVVIIITEYILTGV